MIMESLNSANNIPTSNGSTKEKIILSVIIPVYNRGQYLNHCLNSLFKQNYPSSNYEVIVINDNSKDNTIEVLKKYSKNYNNLHVINNPKRRGSNYSRTLGIKSAKADIIVFTDSDCILPSDWLSKIAKKFENRKVLCVQGTQKCRGKWGKFMHEGEKSLHTLKRKCALDTKNLAIRKKLILQYFFTKAMSNTGDYELGQRLSKDIKIHYDPNIIVIHVCDIFSTSLNRGKRWGEAAAYIYRKYGEEKINKRLNLPIYFLFFYYLGGLLYFSFKYKSFRGGIMFFVTAFLTAVHFKRNIKLKLRVLENEKQ